MAIPAFTLARRLRAGETVYLRLVRPALSARRRNARRATALPPSRSIASTGCGTSPRSSPASPRCARAAPRRSCACRSAISRMVSRALDFGAEGIIAPMINTRRRRARLRRGGEIPAARRAQLGPAPRHDARRPCRSIDLSARGQRPHRHARDDRDPHRARRISTRSPRRRASTACSSARPICRSRCPTARALDPLSKDVEGELDRIVAGAQKAKKIPGAYCHSAERAVALAKRGLSSSRWRAISASCAPAPRRQLKMLKG